MKKITTWMLAAALVAPMSALWASAGDANLVTPAATPATPKTKKHHGHHHKKAQASTPAGTSTPSNTTAPK